jgi:hypothetical protein
MLSRYGSLKNEISLVQARRADADAEAVSEARRVALAAEVMRD